jgi:putative SOS response-associated peptidase YedK
MPHEVRHPFTYNRIMCRRYVSPDQVSIDQEFDLVRSEWTFADNFNAAPTAAVPVIRVIDDQPDSAILNWGFGDPVTFNVPLEALNLSAPDRGLLGRGQRCIIPAMGFYEWQVAANGTQKPFYVRVEDQPVFGFAGLWERESFVIITTPANALMASVDNSEARMPAILARDMREVWLYGSVANAAAALAPYPEDLLVAYPVSARVNSLDNNDESLIEPLETDVD